MATNASTPADSVVCPSCGHPQERAAPQCVRCGAPLKAPGQIYRKLPDGRWSIVEGFDLSSLVPRPAPPQRKLLTRPRLLAIAGVFLWTVLVFWITWREQNVGRDAEVQEIAQYLRQPVGRIVPRFQLRATKGAEGTLRVEGQCNLPTGTVLDVRVFALSGNLLLAVDYPVAVSAGNFTTRALLDRGRPFLAGTYRVQVKADFGERWQPASVLLVVGKLGERLVGPLVERREGSAEAGLTYAENFTLE